MTKFSHFVPRTCASVGSEESEGTKHGSCPQELPASGEENTAEEAAKEREVPCAVILMPMGLVLQVSESWAGTHCQAWVRVMSRRAALTSPRRTLGAGVGIKDGKTVGPLRLVSLCGAPSFCFHASE